MTVRQRLGASRLARKTADVVRPHFRARRPWTGLNEIDQRLLPLLPMRAGVFIEAGANDGIKQSNTHGLAKALGWRGILVEPVPSLAARCARYRPESFVVNAALVAPADVGKRIEIVDLDLMSTVMASHSSSDLQTHVANAAGHGLQPSVVEVVGRTLSEIIISSPFDEIDFLSLDVEGFELPVLEGLDSALHAPKVVLVETADPDAVSQLLGPHYEKPILVTHHDYVWIRSDWLPMCRETPILLGHA